MSHHLRRARNQAPYEPVEGEQGQDDKDLMRVGDRDDRRGMSSANPHEQDLLCRLDLIVYMTLRWIRL